ncbi:MORN repeat-containing protein 3-like isoform X2 [Diabrotica undecimpunctata]
MEERTLKNGLRHTVFNTAKDKYIGDWKRNQKTGKGVLLTGDKDLYEGDFVDNYRHGFGVSAFYLPKHNVFALKYRGDWKNGKKEGRGLRVYPEVGFYIGHFKNGKRYGYGQMWYNCGSFYDGDWVKDQREGLGLLVREDGNRYEGSWHKDQKHGAGRFYFLNMGILQTGVWKNDICTFSTMKNLPFRQSSKSPTVYPLSVATRSIDCIHYTVMLIVAVFMVIVVAEIGQQMQLECDNLLKNILHCKWYQWDKNNCCLLMMILLQIKEPLEVNCYSFVILNRELLLKVYRFIHAYITYFHSMQNTK